ncbi:uncharacterized protein [Misgurnus anguillicaudatus]|uniref:uncharacterized protein n=1 Tax=Misgurnus anguillicaudatus TaxID=75329 RepID=UPI003CCF89F7
MKCFSYTGPDAQPQRPLMRFSERMSVTVNGGLTNRPSFRRAARPLGVTPQMRPTCASQPSGTRFEEFTPRPLHARNDCSLVESRYVSTNWQARGIRSVYPKLLLRCLGPGRIRSADIAQRTVRERNEEVKVIVRRCTRRSNVSPVHPFINPLPALVPQRRRGHPAAPTVSSRALMQDTPRPLLSEEISSAQPERHRALEPDRSLSAVVSQQKPVMVVHPLGRRTRWGRVAPAQQVQPSAARQFQATPIAVVSLPRFTSRGKEQPVQVVRPLGWPTREGLVAPARQDQPPPARQDPTPLARQDPTPPARQDPTPVAWQDATPAAR